MTASVVILKADLMTFPRECRFGLRVARGHSLSANLCLNKPDSVSLSWTPKMRQLAKVEPCP